MNYKRKIAALLLVVMMMTLGGCKDKNVEVVWSQEMGEQTLFKIEDKECSMALAKLLLATYKNLYVQAYGEDIWLQQELSVDIEAYLKEVVVSQLAQIQTMCLLANEQEVVLSGNEKKSVRNAAADYIATLNEAEMEELGVTEEEIETFFMDYALANKLYAKLTSDIDQEVSDNEARIMEVMCVVVEDEETAQVVKQRLEDGGDFQATINYYSIEEDGNRFLNWRDLSKEEKDALNLLENGSISDIIYANEKYYVYKCVNKINRELTEENKLLILEERAKTAVDDVYDEFAKKLKSGYNEEEWDKYVIDFSENVVTNQLFAIYDEQCGYINSGD